MTSSSPASDPSASPPAVSRSVKRQATVEAHRERMDPRYGVTLGEVSALAAFLQDSGVPDTAIVYIAGNGMNASWTVAGDA